MFASAKGKQLMQVRSYHILFNHIPYNLSGLSRTHFFRQPFSKQLYSNTRQTLLVMTVRAGFIYKISEKSPQRQTNEWCRISQLQIKPVTIKSDTECGRRTTDCGLSIKKWTRYKMRTKNYGLSIKHGLGLKKRTTECVCKNSFRKVKLRETDSGLA